MLVIGSKMINTPILSLHVGDQIAVTRQAIIDPEDLRIIAYTLDGPLLRDPEVGNILISDDVREISQSGMIIDSIDRLVNREDIIHLDQVMSLNFNLIGLKVVTQGGKKLGKVVDYTFDSQSFSVYQLIVQRPVFASINDPQLTINRSQIIEIDDFKVTIKHDKEEVKVKKKNEKTEPEEFKPDFVNPFRKPAYEQSDDESASTTSE
jgi:sporulation protein YlmC with PRC-barrel domain